MTEPAAASQGSRWPTTSAITAVTGRIFLLDRPQFTRQMPTFLPADRSGLVLCGRGGNTRIDTISRHATNIPVLIDPGAYQDEVATADAPFSLPGDDGMLFGADLDTVLDGQRDSHATAAITPSRYVQAGDSAAFKALVHAAGQIKRDDVIVAVPVALPWLTQEQYLRQLIAGLQRIRHPKALMFGAQRNPFDDAAAIPNFRRLLAETTDVGLWRADVPAAFDCIAHGGAFATIGAGGSLRHLVPADEKPDANNPGVHTPAVLLPTMLRYSEARFIADKYANTLAPTCDCEICDGASLGRFDSTNAEVRATAHAHNAAVWTGWLSNLFDQPNTIQRQRWWRSVCSAAIDAHDQENARIRQAGAFKPSPH